MKPMFRLALAFCALILVTVPVQAQFEYTVNNGTITITGGCPSSPGAVVIPDTINGLPVTSIGNSAFSGCTNLTSVTIPNSVTSIAQWALEGCSSLIAIDVDPLNQSYSSLDSVLFNKSQTTLIRCPGGKTGAYMIPDSVTSIGTAAFYYCESLTNITIPDSVTSIGDQAFSGCTSLISITIPDSVTSIESGVFSDCTSLTSVVIGNGVTTIEVKAFRGCTSLTSVTIPNSVTSIGSLAFFVCTSLTSITIPDSVTNIGTGAFAWCTSLTRATILNRSASIEHEVFKGCFSLDYAQVGDGAMLFWRKPCPEGAVVIQVTVAGLPVTRLADGFLQNCVSLTKLTIPDSVTSIGDWAFSACYNLTSITIPDSVTTIGDGAFSGCTSLTGAYFQGNAPGFRRGLFGGSDQVTVYRLPGTTGWGPTFAEQPTALWTNPLLSADSVRAGGDGFGFTISWAPNSTFVVEARSDLGSGAWAPIRTNAPSSGTWEFRDPDWKAHPNRFYRVRSP